MPFLELCRKFWDRDLLELPAQVGLLRPRVDTRGDYYEWIIDRLAATSDCYFPFYTPLVSKDWPQEQKNAVVMTRLFLDIDQRENKEGKLDKIEDIWKKAQFFASTFKDNIDLFFSAGKGFHFYVYLTPITYGEMHRERERLYWNLSTWFQYLLDKRAFLSLDRVCRITLTKHSVDPDEPAPIQWKVPISPDMSYKDIIRRSRFPEDSIPEMTSLYMRKPKLLDWRIFLESPDKILNKGA
jgi:hypothetical protein